MKLTTTRNLIKQHYPSGDSLARFDQAYPNIGGDQEVSLLDIINNSCSTVDDVIWALRATVQDSKSVSVEFAKRCAARAARAAAAARAADYAVASDYADRAADYADRAADYADRAADVAVHAATADYAARAADYATRAAAHAARAARAGADERDKQKQDLIELLS